MNFRILLLFSIISLSLGNYFISDSFAIDFTDSTGYSASWAKGSGYQTVLLKCHEFSGDNSRDENWCNEWVAYVLDQGFENFPQSTSESNENISQQTITSDAKFDELRSFFAGFNDPQITFQSEKTIDGIPGHTESQLLRSYIRNGEMIERVLVVELEQSGDERQFFSDLINSLRNDLNNNPNKELVSFGNSDDKNCFAYDVVYESDCVIKSDLLGYYDTVGSMYSNGEFVDPKASCFLTGTVKTSSEYTKSIWCIKGKYYVLQSTVWDKLYGAQEIPLVSHIIKSIDMKYGYQSVGLENLLEDPDDNYVYLSSDDNKLKKTPIQTTVIPKGKIQETPKTKQDCIDVADTLLGTATPATSFTIINRSFDNYLACMENIGKPLSQDDSAYGFTLSQANKIQETQDDCEFFAVTKNTNNQEKMENELQKCHMQYIKMAQTAMQENRAKSMLQSENIPPTSKFISSGVVKMETAPSSTISAPIRTSSEVTPKQVSGLLGFFVLIGIPAIIIWLIIRKIKKNNTNKHQLKDPRFKDF